jgi:hypothetical protein
VADSLDALTVEYDATRLQPAEVEAALTGAGYLPNPSSTLEHHQCQGASSTYGMMMEP